MGGGQYRINSMRRCRRKMNSIEDFQVGQIVPHMSTLIGQDASFMQHPIKSEALVLCALNHHIEAQLAGPGFGRGMGSSAENPQPQACLLKRFQAVTIENMKTFQCLSLA